MGQPGHMHGGMGLKAWPALGKERHCKLAFYERAGGLGPPGWPGLLQTAFTPVPENSLLGGVVAPSKTNLGFLEWTCSVYVLS